MAHCVGLGGPGPGQSIDVYFPYNGWIRLIEVGMLIAMLMIAMLMIAMLLIAMLMIVMLMIAMMMIVMLTKIIEKNLRLNAETGTDGSLYAAGEKLIMTIF